MSAMSASPVKPAVLAPAGVPTPPPVVTSSQKVFPNLPANLPASLTIAPSKPANMNHSSMPLSLIADSKITAQFLPQPQLGFPPQAQPGIPALQPISQPLLRTPEKPKELTTVPLVMPPKPTSNGMEGPPVPPPALPEPQVTALPPPIPPPKPEVPEATQPSLPEPKPVPAAVAVPPAIEQKTEAKEEPVLAKPVAVAVPEEAPAAPAPSPTVATPVVPTVSATASAPPAPPSSVQPPPPPPPEPAVPPVPPTTVAVAPPPPPATAPPLKVATIPRQAAKRKRENKPASGPGPAPDMKKEIKEKDEDRKSKRVRLPTQPYQSPIPELTIIAKISKGQAASASKPGRGQTKASDDKLIVFYKNEFLAVRNAEGSFYVCQTMQNIYKSSPRIRIRWLSQQDGKDTYSPDFYDHTDFDCILTNLNLEKVDKDVWRLPGEEHQRTQSILKRALDVERGVSEKPPVTEEHPDGLDLSLYRDESQLKKSKRREKDSSSKSEEEDENAEEDENLEEDEDKSEDDDEEEKPSKKTNKKSSPKTKRKKKSAKKKAPPEKKAAPSGKSATTATKRTESSRAVKRRTSDPQPPAPEKRAKKAETSSERTNKLRSVGERRARSRK